MEEEQPLIINTSLSTSTSVDQDLTKKKGYGSVAFFLAMLLSVAFVAGTYVAGSGSDINSNNNSNSSLMDGSA